MPATHPTTAAAFAEDRCRPAARAQAQVQVQIQTHFPFTDDHLWGGLKQTLLAFSRAPGGRLVYVANHGNAGDALIAAGAWQLFDLLGLAPLQVSTHQLRPDDRAIYAGGGNFIADYQDCKWFLQRCLQLGLPGVLLLPHTVRGHAKLLGAMGSRFTLFCREQASLQWATAQAPQAHVMFAHDLALGIDVSRLMAGTGGGLGLPMDLLGRPRQLLRYIGWRWRITRVRPQPDGLLRIMRCDVERTADQTGPPGQDLSNLYGSGFCHRADCDRISRQFLQVLSAARLVETNRLHVGIGSALLGKQVLLHDNSYGKLRDIFNASLRGMPNVRFAGDPA